MLLIGVSDGIVYSSHPEFTRHYSQPPEKLTELAEYARSRGLSVAPKLNFSESEVNCHSHWMRAPGEQWHTHFDDEYYWQAAFECIDEVIDLCGPDEFFHVGMDEDHNRSYTQFVEALRKLEAGIRSRGLRTLSWSDSGLDYASGQIYREKSEKAEREIDTDLVRVLWNYWAVPEDAARTIREQKLGLWCAPGRDDPAQIAAFRDLGKEVGAEGILMTNWRIANADNEGEMLEVIRTMGPLYNE